MQIGLMMRNLFQKRAQPRVQTKGLTIVDDGFIPADVVQLSQFMSGRTEEGLDSNVVMAPVMWIMRTFPDAVARVQQRTGEDWDWIEHSDVEELIGQPNPWYNGDALWQATCLSYTLNGNAYWQKVRNSFGQVKQLWYRPHWSLKPHSPPDGSAFIDYYEYQTSRGIERLNVRDVVHFRFGLDPRDQRLGFAPLRTLLREMLSDQEAARFSIRLLENMGIPGVVVSPDGDSFRPSRPEVEELKEYLTTHITGNGRGSHLVFGSPTKISQFGFDPSQMTLPDVRNNAEERVCAVLGVPAAVVGFRSGMEQTKVGATMKELVRLAWKQCLFPMQRALARQLNAQLLSDFVADYRHTQRVQFDVSDAAGLKEDAVELTERVCKLTDAGILRVDQAQGLAGLEVDETQKVYLRKMTVMPVPAEEVPEPMVLAEPAEESDDVKSLMELRGIAARYATLGNGNGHHSEEAT
jgi:HK97 family phage portal protein